MVALIDVLASVGCEMVSCCRAYTWLCYDDYTNQGRGLLQIGIILLCIRVVMLVDRTYQGQAAQGREERRDVVFSQECVIKQYRQTDRQTDKSLHL
jgi:hypothetical protein